MGRNRGFIYTKLYTRATIYKQSLVIYTITSVRKTESIDLLLEIDPVGIIVPQFLDEAMLFYENPEPLFCLN